LYYPAYPECDNLGKLAVGGKVNLEVDLIARYLDRLNQYDRSDNPGAQPGQKESSINET